MRHTGLQALGRAEVARLVPSIMRRSSIALIHQHAEDASARACLALPDHGYGRLSDAIPAQRDVETCEKHRIHEQKECT
jgi:hypothetical protein